MPKPSCRAITLVHWLGLALVGLALALIVWALSVYRVWLPGEAMRDTFVFQAACLAKTIDTGWREDLGGDPAVADARAKRLALIHFERCRRVFGWKGVWTVRRGPDGRLSPGVTSDPAAFQSFIAGATARDAVAQVLATGEALFVRLPGGRSCALAPVADPVTGRYVRALVVESEDAGWLAFIRRIRIGTWMMFLPLFLLAPLVFVLPLVLAEPRRQRLLCAMEGCLAAVLTLAFLLPFVRIGFQREAVFDYESFLGENHLHVSALYTKVSLVNSIASVGGVFASDRVEDDPGAFAAVFRPLLRISMVKGISWVEPVTEAERPMVEKRIGVPFWEPGTTAGVRVPASARPLHYVILRSARHPSLSQELPVGLDIAGAPARLAGILEAVSGRCAVVIGQLRHLDGREGFTVLRPIYRPNGDLHGVLALPCSLVSPIMGDAPAR